MVSSARKGLFCCCCCCCNRCSFCYLALTLRQCECSPIRRSVQEPSRLLNVRRCARNRTVAPSQPKRRVCTTFGFCFFHFPPYFIVSDALRYRSSSVTAVSRSTALSPTTRPSLDTTRNAARGPSTNMPCGSGRQRRQRQRRQ